MTTPPPPMQPSHDVLGAPEPAARAGGRRGLLIGLGTAGALAVAGGAVAAATFLGGGGAQPEEVIPASALGMVKLDLDPAAGQKLAVYRLAKKFPTTQAAVDDEDSVKDQLLSALFGEQEELDYGKDVQPWIGDRVAVAALPGGEEPAPLVAVAYTDRGKADKALGDLQAEDDTLFYAFSEKADYVLLGESQDVVDDAAGATKVLADSAAWDKGMDALDGDQIVTLWADLDAISESLPQEARDEAAEVYGLDADEFTLGGLVVAGARAAAGHVEVVGKALDVQSPVQLDAPVGGGEGGDLVSGFPADAVAAVSVTNLGDGLAELFDSVYSDDDPLGLIASAKELGLAFPDDLRTLLGEQTAAAVLSESHVALRVRSEDPAASHRAWEQVTSLAGGGGDPAAQLQQTEDGVVVGSNPEALQQVLNGSGLGDSETFRSAVPDAADAGYLLYVDIARWLEVFDGEGAEDARQLQAVGITGSGDKESSTFRLRLTVQE